MEKLTGDLIRDMNKCPPKYEIICFDLDGTLLDSQQCHIEAWRQAAAEINRRFPAAPPILITPEFEHHQSGRSNDDAVKFHGIDPGSERGRLFIDLKKRAAVAGAPHARWYSDALAALPLLQERGYRAMIVTSSQRAFVARVLAGQGTLGFLAGNVVAREDYDRPKPRPDALFAAFRAAGVPPGGAIYIGDTAVDLQSSEEAGCAFLLYDPHDGPSAAGLEGAVRMRSHSEIWSHI
jgi:beta-phosphoglucomutase-like phosphatase (HAD superfamily)